MKPLEQIARVALREHLNAFDSAAHMARLVRALSYRIPVVATVGARSFRYSISGWRGAV